MPPSAQPFDQSINQNAQPAMVCSVLPTKGSFRTRGTPDGAPDGYKIINTHGAGLDIRIIVKGTSTIATQGRADCSWNATS
jgi:hypothetical protein